MTLNTTGIASQEPSSREILTLIHPVKYARATGVYRPRSRAIRERELYTGSPRRPEHGRFTSLARGAKQCPAWQTLLAR